MLSMTWTGSIAGASVTMDGKDMWSAIVSGGASPRHEILHLLKSGTRLMLTICTNTIQY